MSFIIAPKTIKLGINDRRVLHDALVEYVAKQKKRMETLKNNDMAIDAEIAYGYAADLVTNDFFEEFQS